VSDALAAGWAVRLWALDETAPELAHVTAGTGPGTKFDLLNVLLAGLAPVRGWLVVTDDDIDITWPRLARLLGIAERAGFGLVGAAHGKGSHISHDITRRRWRCTARWTSFVEIGPLFAVSSAWQDRIVPFPSGLGMAWGLELEWMKLEAEGLRLGIVDAVPVVHAEPPGAGYAADAERSKQAERFAAHGVRGWPDVQRVHAEWRRWRRRPPWT
jgi:hypothetical protein